MIKEHGKRSKRNHGEGSFRTRQIDGSIFYKLYKAGEIQAGYSYRFRGDNWKPSKNEAIVEWERTLAKKQSVEATFTTQLFTPTMTVADASLLVAEETGRAGVVYSANTKRVYKTLSRKIRELIPSLRLKDVRESHYRQLRTMLETPRVGWSGKGSSVNLTMWLLDETITRAYASGAIDELPLRRTERAVRKSLFKKMEPTKQKRASLTYTKEEVDKIMNFMPAKTRQTMKWGKAAARVEKSGRFHHAVYANRIFFINQYCGLRIAEAAALQWKDIEFATDESGIGYLTVNKQFDQHEVTEPKTKNGIRRIAFPKQVNDMLLHHLSQWTQDRLASGHQREWAYSRHIQAWNESQAIAPVTSEANGVPDEGLLFPTRMGTCRYNSDLLADLREINKELGIYVRGRGNHGFRRFMASDAVPFIDPIHLGQRLGHSPNINVTNLYTNLSTPAFENESDRQFQNMWNHQKEA